MCIEVSNELTLFSQELQQSLSHQSLQQMARKVGYVQRTSKYQAKDLIALCAWLSQKVASTSLTQLCSSLESSTGVLISPEGLNQRFNPSSVKLLQHVFTSLLTQKLYTSQALPHRYVAQFQRIFKNGTIKKETEYIQLDLEEIMSQLKPEQTFEITDVYIGQYQKLPARVIFHRLTEAQTRKRWKDQALKEKKKGIVMKERSKRLSAMNVYITNASPEHVPTKHVHDLYSLRWQIEILFKTWKSFFKIDYCKEIKKERLECYLYGQLIAILLCSSTIFQMRQLLLIKKKQELSEFKAIYIIKDYFALLFQAIQKDTQELSKVLFLLFVLLQKNGRKSHRYEKKTVFDILGVVY
jgi:hypothetical protein